MSGASLTFAFAPFNLWPITLLALTLFVRQLITASRSHAFLHGWLFGLGWFGAGISWVHVSIADFGGLPLLASLAMMFALCAYLAIYPALVTHIVKRWVALNYWPLVMPLVWFGAEWLRSWFLSGFPWLSIGYSQLNSPLSGWLPVIGETGLSALLILLAASIATATVALKSRRPILACGLIVIVAFVSGYTLNNVKWTKPHKSVDIAMVQGNIAQSLRWVPEQDWPTMEKYVNLTEPVWQSDLIIWPEAAIPKMEPLAEEFVGYLDELASAHNTALVTGIVNYNFESAEAWNNLLVVGKKLPDDKSGHYRYFHNNRYAKHHLLPVGEFVPFETLLRPLAPIFDLPMSSFSRGDFQQTNLVANGITLAPAICFEIAFPRQVAANIHENTDFVITVSNDAWFGSSHGPHQHLEIAQVRAKEFGIPVLRATNNGITAFINENGDVVSRLPQFEAGSLTTAMKSTRGATPYRSLGDTIPFVLLLILAIIGIAMQHRAMK